MNKPSLALIAMLLMSAPFITTAASPTDDKIKMVLDKVIPSGTILDSLIPDRKNCNFVRDHMYEPFSDIDSSFPGVGNMMEDGRSRKLSCVKITGGTEKLITMLFNTAITIIIVLTVINIAVAGIQYMTEQAAGQVVGKGKKRLKDSLVALALGLLSYTILYTVNKQLVNFTFNPVSIDITGAIDRGIQDANNATGTFSSGLGGIESVGTPTFAQSPTGYVNRITGAPCQAPSPTMMGPQDPNCVQQSTLAAGGVVSPTGYMNRVTGAPCPAPSATFSGPPDPNCVQQSTVAMGGTGSISNGSFGAWNETTAENWVRGLSNGQRSVDGRLVLSTYSATKDTTVLDKNSREKRGFSNNLLREGSIAFSPDLISKYKPQMGQEVLINGTCVGFYEDKTAGSFNGVVFNNTIDIYDENGTLGTYLKNIPSGQWNMTFGNTRAQITNR